MYFAFTAKLCVVITIQFRHCCLIWFWVLLLSHLGRFPLSLMMAANELSFVGLILNIETLKADTREVTEDV